MANAKTRDARAGFAIYLKSSEGITLDAINARLESSGYGTIAQRTLTHYRNLVKAGFDRYISINRFDVARASRAYENMSTLSRYRYRSTDQEVSVLFSRGSWLLEAQGKLTESGDVGSVIEFSDEDVLAELQRFRPRSGVAVTLYHANGPKSINGVVIDCDLTSRPALVEIEYATLVSLAEIEDSRPLQHRLVQFRLISEDQDVTTIDVIGRRLHHFFDLLEGIRALLNEAGRYSEEYTYAAPPVVQEIRVASPAVLLLQVPPELVSLVSWPLLLALLPSLRKVWHQGTREKREGQLVNVKRYIAEQDLEARKKEDTLHSDMIDNLRAQLPNSSIPEEELRKFWYSYILPSYRALARSDVREIDVTMGEVSYEDSKMTDEEGADDDG